MVIWVGEDKKSLKEGVKLGVWEKNICLPPMDSTLPLNWKLLWTSLCTVSYIIHKFYVQGLDTLPDNSFDLFSLMHKHDPVNNLSDRVTVHSKHSGQKTDNTHQYRLQGASGREMFVLSPWPWCIILIIGISISSSLPSPCAWESSKAARSSTISFKTNFSFGGKSLRDRILESWTIPSIL